MMRFGVGIDFAGVCVWYVWQTILIINIVDFFFNIPNLPQLAATRFVQAMANSIHHHSVLSTLYIWS